MTLDDAILADVEAARAALDELEDRAFDARARFHREVRRLHGAGGSLREIAAALGLSHQRVHQIVGEDGVVEVEAASREVAVLPGALVVAPPGADPGGGGAGAGPGAGFGTGTAAGGGPGGGAGGGPGGGTRPVMVRRTTRLRCAFCNAGRSDTARMVAGPGVHICQQCVADAAGVAATRRPARGPRQVTLRDAMAEPHACRFCGRTPAQVAGMVAGGRGRICADCLRLAADVLGAGSPPDPR
ncbi:MAG TPA: ClpX C4-type zinc finger protein [Acidimicrobiales bacterium]|nr:ClpX C4-type zinc finger protein [Acidimicrobiales bacterium]